LKKVLILLSVLFFSLLFANDLTLSANSPPVKGGELPVINLPIPKNPNEKFYLGLHGDGFFKIQQIKAKALLIKIFNIYCPTCQSTAAAMTELYHEIERNADLKSKLKLIGVGAGNSPSEVEVFKQTHHVAFPIFPDEDFKIHKVLGEVRIPFFIVIKMNGDGSNEIIHTHLGALTEVQSILNLMLDADGIDGEDLLKREKLTTSTAIESSSHDE